MARAYLWNSSPQSPRCGASYRVPASSGSARTRIHSLVERNGNGVWFYCCEMTKNKISVSAPPRISIEIEKDAPERIRASSSRGYASIEFARLVTDEERNMTTTTTTTTTIMTTNIFSRQSRCVGEMGLWVHVSRLRQVPTIISLSVEKYNHCQGVSTRKVDSVPVPFCHVHFTRLRLVRT